MRKTVLITGGSRGIGRATAYSFNDPNLNIVINYRQDKKSALEVVDNLRKRGMNSIAIQADISNYEEVEKMFEQIEDNFGYVDILINNAGIANGMLAQEASPEDWRHIFGTNVDGAFYCCKLAIPHMVSNKSGVIVNVASIWGETGGAMESHYGATKGALLSFTKALAKELAPSNIRVNAVSPGCIDTDMISVLSQETIDAFAMEVPMGRIGQPKK